MWPHTGRGTWSLTLNLIAQSLCSRLSWNAMQGLGWKSSVSLYYTTWPAFRVHFLRSTGETDMSLFFSLSREQKNLTFGWKDELGHTHFGDRSFTSNRHYSLYVTREEPEAVSLSHLVGWVRNPGFKSQIQRPSSVLLTYHFLEEQEKEDPQTISRKIQHEREMTSKLLRDSSSKAESKTTKESPEIGLSSPGVSTSCDSECFSRIAPRATTNHSGPWNDTYTPSQM